MECCWRSCRSYIEQDEKCRYLDPHMIADSHDRRSHVRQSQRWQDSQEQGKRLLRLAWLEYLISQPDRLWGPPTRADKECRQRLGSCTANEVQAHEKDREPDLVNAQALARDVGISGGTTGPSSWSCTAIVSFSRCDTPRLMISQPHQVGTEWAEVLRHHRH